MKHTVVGVFHAVDAAEQAAREIQQQGFSPEQVHITDSTLHRTSAAQLDGEDEGLFGGVRRFFGELFGSDENARDADEYTEAVRRGQAVVAVDVDSDDESRVIAARQALRAAGAVDIEEQVQQWRQSGWTGDSDRGERVGEDADTRAPGSTASAAAAAGVAAASMAGVAAVGLGRDASTPVPDERTRELFPGDERRDALGEANRARRVFSEAGVRVYSRESARIAAQDSLEARDSLGLGDDLKRPDDPLRGDLLHDGLGTARSWDDAAPAYRRDWESRYGTTGGAWDDWVPAYRYGHSLATDDRYRGRPWDEIEGEVQRDWESHYPGSAWQRFKDAVRHAWDRVTN